MMSEHSAVRGTILTVGMTHEPVVYSLRQINPKWAAFICTPESTKTLDLVWKDFPMPPSQVRVRDVRDAPTEIGRLVQEFYGAFLWLRDDCGVAPANILTDPTPGRKWMSAGTTMMASFLGLPMFYTDVRFVDGKPDSSTMQFVPLGNAFDQTGFLEAEKGRDLFNRHEYHAAAEVFGQVHPTLSAQADLFAGLAKLSATLHRWDLFEHYEDSLREPFSVALEPLDRCCNSVPTPPGFREFLTQSRRLAEAIEEVTTSSKPNPLATVDLVLNAERRVDQGRFDDAAARSYRALESLSQLFLETRHRIAASNASYTHLTDLQRQSIQGYLGALPDKLALENGWTVLWALNDPAAQMLFQHDKKHNRLQNKFAGILDDRNNSILAHGWNPVGGKRAGNMVAKLKEFLVQTQGRDVEEAFARLQPPALPGFYSPQ